MTRTNILCHQRKAAESIIREQMERLHKIDEELSILCGVTIRGGHVRVDVEDFTVEILRGRNRPAQIHVEERPVVNRETLAAAGVACAGE
jgi:hypothetical protein